MPTKTPTTVNALYAVEQIRLVFNVSYSSTSPTGEGVFGFSVPFCAANPTGFLTWVTG